MRRDPREPDQRPELASGEFVFVTKPKLPGCWRFLWVNACPKCRHETIFEHCSRCGTLVVRRQVRAK